MELRNQMEIADSPQVAQRTDLGEVEDMQDENIWGLIGDLVEWTIETEVPLGVVIVLLLIGGIREGMAWWFSGRHNNG